MDRDVEHKLFFPPRSQLPDGDRVLLQWLTTNIWFKVTNPINRDNSQSLHVQVQPDSNCMGGFVSGASAQDLQGNQTITGCPAPMNCQNSDTPPSWTFDNTGLVQGNISFSVNQPRRLTIQPGDA